MQAVRPVESNQDMRDVYTPGVARVSQAIAEHPGLATRFTTIGRTVAICTNGTRVLGLGDIGPVASMPVMEGKAMFYSQLAGISAVPILIDTKDVDEFVEAVVRIARTFGGIHLEDISAPECFEIERRLIEELDRPVMHDDVHGTAVVSLAAAIVACREADRRLDRSVIGQIGLGAAGFGIASLIKEAGAERVIASDPGEEARERASDVRDRDGRDRWRRSWRSPTSSWRRPACPGLIKPELVREGQVILALSNPDPEITIDDALAAGAAFAADGTVVNNVLGYPGMFRGALLAGARSMTTEMKRAAAWAIAGLTVDAERLVPDVLDPQVHTPSPRRCAARRDRLRRWRRARRSPSALEESASAPRRSRRRCRWADAAAPGSSDTSSRGGRGGRARPGAWPRALPCDASRGPSCRRRRGR